jgi:hypothetical protein
VLTDVSERPLLKSREARRSCYTRVEPDKRLVGISRCTDWKGSRLQAEFQCLLKPAGPVNYKNVKEDEINLYIAYTYSCQIQSSCDGLNTVSTSTKMLLLNYMGQPAARTYTVISFPYSIPWFTFLLEATFRRLGPMSTLRQRVHSVRPD